jgi:pimeloyl-ACP methyl ester carboxylesterase
VTLRWRVEGTGPVLVLLHGWALSLDYWDLVAPLLAQKFRVLRFDRRGFGQSTGAPSLAADRDDLFALLDEIGAEHATLLGMSQGARVAVAAALSDNQRIKALILDGAPDLLPESGTSGDHEDDDKEHELPLDHYRQLLATQGRPAMQVAVLQHPLMQLAFPSQAAQEILERCVGQYSGADLNERSLCMAPVDPHHIQQPALIVNGAADTAARLQAGSLLQAAVTGTQGRAQRVVLRQAGHLAALDQPNAYCRVISGFALTQ